jgi:hypothetical protein
MNLIEAFSLGLIPGPNESEAAFFERCEHCLKSPLNSETVPHGVTTLLTLQEKEEIALYFQKSFSFIPSWAPCFYSSKELPFWQGAATWITESEEGGLSAYIQLHPLLKRSLLKKLYPIREIVAHEWIHIARMAFNCPRYEEILAYQTSKGTLRRYLGPFFSQSWESMALVGGFLTLFLSASAAVFLPNLFGSEVFLGLYLLISSFNITMVVRLIFRQRIFRRCLKILTQMTHCSKRALNLMIALTDSEIEQLSTSLDPLRYFRERMNRSMRNQLLYQLSLNP